VLSPPLAVADAEQVQIFFSNWQIVRYLAAQMITLNLSA
jgi:hypothetical protein